MNKYDDIINLPHYELKNHKRMSMESRAAQFAPFAALTGYSEAVSETARITDKKHELDEDTKKDINKKLQLIDENIKNKPLIKIIYFVPDKRKNGGKYVSYVGNVKKLDNVNKKIIFKDDNKIKFNDIMDIDIYGR